MRVVDEVGNVVATDGELALIGDEDAVFLAVAVHVGDARETGNHARAVGVAQAALYVVLAVKLLVVLLHRGAGVEALGGGGDAARLCKVLRTSLRCDAVVVILVDHAASLRMRRLEAAPLRRGGMNRHLCQSNACSGARFGAPSLPCATGDT